MTVDQAMILSYSIVLVCANVYLYKFLITQEARNKSIIQTKNEADLRKTRKRNLVPAGAGLIHSIVFGVTYLCKHKWKWNFVRVLTANL